MYKIKLKCTINTHKLLWLQIPLLFMHLTFSVLRNSKGLLRETRARVLKFYIYFFCVRSFLLSLLQYRVCCCCSCSAPLPLKADSTTWLLFTYCFFLFQRSSPHRKKLRCSGVSVVLWKCKPSRP